VEGLALGVLGVSVVDLPQMTVRQLLNALNARRGEVMEMWEMVRVISAYSVAPYSKKGMSFKDIQMPLDKVSGEVKEKRKEGKRIVLQAEEIRETYRRAGFKVTDEFINNVLSIRQNGKG